MWGRAGLRKRTESTTLPNQHKERMSMVFWKEKMQSGPLGIRKDKREISHVMENVWGKSESVCLKSRQATST